MKTLHLAPMLTVGRLRSRAGDAWLDVLAVASFALSTAMTLTVAGGVWMFYTWANDPSERLLKTFARLDLHPSATEAYLVFALFAVVLLAFPVFSLGSSAARLGAQGRSERLASLRLVGATSGQVILIALVETVIQWVIGAAIGVILYVVTLPLWSHAHFLTVAIDPAEMLVPAWMLAIVLAVLLTIAVISTLVGLQKVRISPLGVAKRHTPKALRMWRLFVLAGAIVLFCTFAIFPTADFNNQGRLVVIALLSVTIIAIAIAAPFIIQLLAAPFTLSHFPSVVLAARRIMDDPRAVWRAVGALSILCFIGGFTSVMDFATVSTTKQEIPPEVILFTHDVPLGVTITLGIGFAVSALSTLMNQASGVFDRLTQTQALDRMGFPRHLFTLVRLFQSFAPLVVTSILFAALGRGLSLASTGGRSAATDDTLVRLLMIGGIGLGMSLVALLICTPLERHVLAALGRAND